MSARLRWVIVALSLAGATCLAIGAQGGRWFWLGETIAVGPTGTMSCFNGDCKTSDLSALQADDSEVWRRAGLGTAAAGLLGAIALVAVGGSLAAKRSGKLAAGATLTASLTGAVASAVFVITRPSTDVPATIGRGVVIYAVGLVLALAVAVFVL